MEENTTFDSIHEDFRRKYHPTKQEFIKDYTEKSKEMREKFMAYLIDLVEQSVRDKRKSVRIPVQKREDVSKLRHLIRRISKEYGYQIKSMKKRHVIVENTKFIVEIHTPQVKKVVKKEE